MRRAAYPTCSLVPQIICNCYVGLHILLALLPALNRQASCLYSSLLDACGPDAVLGQMKMDL